MVTPFVKVSQGVTGINAGDAGAGGVPEAAAAAIPAAASSAQAREATGTVVSKDGGEHGTIPGGGESGGGDEVGGAESQMLTSGNLRQLHLASISSPVGEKKVMAANDAEGGDPGIEGDHGAAATADPPPPHESGDAVFMTPGERKADGASPTASATSAPSVTASVGTAATTVMTTEAAAMAAAAAAAAVEEAPRETGHHGAEATAPAEYPTGQGFSTAPPGDAQETCGVLSADRVMGVPEGVGGPSEVGILGPGSGSTVGGVRGGGGSTPSAAGPGMHVDGGTSGKSRHNTLHSDASTDDGTSAAGTAPYWSRHWEEFTNNDIVDQVRWTRLRDVACRHVMLYDGWESMWFQNTFLRFGTISLTFSVKTSISWHRVTYVTHGKLIEGVLLPDKLFGGGGREMLGFSPPLERPLFTHGRVAQTGSSYWRRTRSEARLCYLISRHHESSIVGTL